MPFTKTVIFVVGPTAVGKTKFAIDLANHFRADIISADSRQFYKDIGIGTAKPTVEELSQATHHFVDFLPIEASYSSGQFEKDSLAFLQEYFIKKDICICAGGSGLYVNSVLYGFDELPSSDKIREAIQFKFKSEGLSALQKELKELDPEHYSTMDIHNSQRVMRALEVCLSSGRKYSDLRTNSIKKRPFNSVILGLNRDREELYGRINMRVDQMFTEGLEEEARNVFPKRECNSLQTVGYRELFSYFSGEIDLQEATRLIKRNTRRFAKRQVTWFKRYDGIEWFHPEELSEAIKFCEPLVK